ncbi:hypothetical protein L218DRAFT_950622 [Marasmius fiardii PR-910]|nr:hypothetical protein L218DRAFT_950622 [Marasmius fiardii PR-910]
MRGSQGVLLLENWAQICYNVDNPSEGLLFQLYHINLGEVIRNIVDGDSEDLSLTMSNLHCLFRDFGTILSWLRLKASGVFLPLLSTQFETIQRGFHIQSTRQDMESGLHNNIVTMITTQRKAETQPKICPKAAVLNYEHTTTPVLNTEDMYDINIQASYIQILNKCIADLQSMQDVDEKQSMVDSLLVHGSLLTQCLPQPRLLPIYQTLVATAMRMGRGVDYRRWIALKESRPKESRDKILSWLKLQPFARPSVGRLLQSLGLNNLCIEQLVHQKEFVTKVVYMG